MRTIVLAAVLLLLLSLAVAMPSGVVGGNRLSKEQKTEVKQLAHEKFKFGDIIGFQRKFGFTYKHYGVYIDRLRFKDLGQQEGQDLFHITGPTYTIFGCIFGKVADEMTLNAHVHNYLDNISKFSITIGTEKEIEERIRKRFNDCKTWKPLARNCEHLATYIRYGISISLQLDQSCEGKCHSSDKTDHNLSKETEKLILQEVKRLYEGTDISEYNCKIDKEFLKHNKATNPSPQG